MKNSLMRFLAGAALLALALPCAAQAYPAKPILMLMPLQAGSAVDVMIRIVAQKMSENLGQQIVIENQPGAAGSIGAERVKRSAPDGYTVGVLNDSILTMIPNIRQVAYDPLKDFVPVGVVAAITWVMVVSNELPAKSVAEFVALAKSRPGKIDYSSGGNGAGALRRGVHHAAVYQGRPHARSGRAGRGALAAIAPGADRGRGGSARVRVAHLGVVRRAARHAQRNRRAAERGDGQGGELPRRPREADRPGPRADRLQARDGHAVDP